MSFLRMRIVMLFMAIIILSCKSSQETTNKNELTPYKTSITKFNRDSSEADIFHIAEHGYFIPDKYDSTSKAAFIDSISTTNQPVKQNLKQKPPKANIFLLSSDDMYNNWEETMENYRDMASDRDLILVVAREGNYEQLSDFNLMFYEFQDWFKNHKVAFFRTVSLLKKKYGKNLTLKYHFQEAIK